MPVVRPTSWSNFDCIGSVHWCGGNLRNSLPPSARRPKARNGTSRSSLRHAGPYETYIWDGETPYRLPLCSTWPATFCSPSRMPAVVTMFAIALSSDAIVKFQGGGPG